MDVNSIASKFVELSSNHKFEIRVRNPQISEKNTQDVRHSVIMFTLNMQRSANNERKITKNIQKPTHFRIPNCAI